MKRKPRDRRRIRAEKGYVSDQLNRGRVQVGKRWQKKSGSSAEHTVDDDNAMCAPVVRRSNGSKSLLSSRVPDLQLERLAVQFESSNFLLEKEGRKKDEISIEGKNHRKRQDARHWEGLMA